MDKTIETQSLFFLNTLSSTVEKARSAFPFLDESLPPSEILSLSDKYLKLIQVVDGSVSVLTTVGKQLESEYYRDIQQYRDIQNQLINRLNERKATGAQLNINVELYDGENLYLEILRTEGKAIEVNPVTKPEEYSVLKIVERLKKDGVALNITKERDGEMFASLKEGLGFISSSILTIRRLLNNSNYMALMSTDTASQETIAYSTALFRNIRMIAITLEEIRNVTTEAFQLHLAISHNYEIYQKAIDSITKIALESIFDPTATYEIL